MKTYNYDFEKMVGGYRELYNPLAVLKSIAANPSKKDVWEEAWENIYHQDDIGDASYASVVILSDIFSGMKRVDDFYNLVCSIEIARHKKSNPRLPYWIKSDYKKAINIAGDLAQIDLGKTDGLECRLLLATIAAKKGEIKLTAALITLDDSTMDELLDQYLAWPDQFQNIEK